MRLRPSAARVAIAALLLSLACATAKHKPGAQPIREHIPARLTIKFERSRYAAGEPILGLARIQSLSTDSITDIPAIDIAGERLRLAVRDLDRSTMVRRVGLFATIMYLAPGLTLGPGDSYVEVLDLSNHYGAGPDSGQPMHALMSWSLPPGRYEARASVVPNTDLPSTPRRAPLFSDPVMFEIAAEQPDASRDRIWRGLMSVPWTRNTISSENRRICQQLLSEAANSPWFWLMFEASGPMSESEFQSLLQSVRHESAPNIRSAILLARRYRSPLKDQVRYIQLLEARYSEGQSDAERHVLSTLRMKATQKKYTRWARDDAYE